MRIFMLYKIGFVNPRKLSIWDVTDRNVYRMHTVELVRTRQLEKKKSKTYLRNVVLRRIQGI
jgi:hypothetical protein